MIKRLLVLLAFVPGVAAADCHWINGYYVCSPSNNYYAPPPTPSYYYAPPSYYYAPPPVYVPPPVTPGYIAPPPADWGNTKIVPLPERRSFE